MSVAIYDSTLYKDDETGDLVYGYDNDTNDNIGQRAASGGLANAITTLYGS